MMNPKLAQLQEKYAQLEVDYQRERAALDKQIADTRERARADALAKIRSIMTEYGIAASDFGADKRPGKRKRPGPVAAKYRGPNGEKWSGRGRQPKWLGDDREQFLIRN